MIVINECRIDDEGKRLIIEASIDTLTYYKDVYINAIIIDTDETYSESGPSSNPIYSKEFDPIEETVEVYDDSSEDVVSTNACGGILSIESGKTEVNILRKHIRMVLTASDLSLSSLKDNIFFVYIEAAGTPDVSTPCTMDNQYTIGIAIDYRSIYNSGLKYLKELSKECSLPKGFIDYILRFKALQLALRTGHYLEAINYWKKFFNAKVTESINTGCGCGT